MILTEKHWLLKPPSIIQTDDSKRSQFNQNILAGLPDGFMDSESDDDPYSKFMSESEFESDDEPYVITGGSALNGVGNSPQILEKPVILLNDFRCAIQSGTLDKVKKEFEVMKSRGFQMHHQLDGNWNALMFACSAAQPEVLRFLIQEGADPKWTTMDVLNGLHALACGAKSNSEVLRKNHSLQSTLEQAKEQERVSKKVHVMQVIVRTLYQLLGSELKEERKEQVQMNRYEDTDKKDVLEVANMLLKGGANVNLRDRDLAATPLHFAVKNKAADLIVWLLANNADINAEDRSLNTPLGWAAARGFGPIVKILLQHHADTQIINSSGLMAYEVAGFQGFKKVAKSIWLYQTGAVNSVDELSGLNEYETKCLESKGSEVTNSLKQINTMLIDAQQRKHFPKFQEMDMTLHEFLLIDNTDLETLGVTQLSDRIRIMDIIRRVHLCDWKPASLPKLSLHSSIKATDVLNTCQMISFKLNVMRSTIKYLTACAAVPEKCQSLTNPGLEAKQLERIISYCGKIQHALDELKSAAELFVDSVHIAELTIDLKIGDLLR